MRFDIQALRNEFAQVTAFNEMALFSAVRHFARYPDAAVDFYNMDSDVRMRISRLGERERKALAAAKRLILVPSSELALRAAYSNAVEEAEPKYSLKSHPMEADRAKLRIQYLDLVRIFGRYDVAIAAQLLHISTDLVVKIRDMTHDKMHRMSLQDFSFTTQPVGRALSAMVQNVYVEADDIATMSYGLMIAPRPIFQAAPEDRLPVTTASQQNLCAFLADRLIVAGVPPKKAMSLANCSGKIRSQLELSYQTTKSTRSAKSLRPVYKNAIKHAVSSHFLVSYIDALALHMPDSPKIQPDAFARALILTQCSLSPVDGLIPTDIFTSQQALNIAEHYHQGELTCQNCKSCGSRYMQEEGPYVTRQKCPGCSLLSGREIASGRGRAGRRSSSSHSFAGNADVSVFPMAKNPAAHISERQEARLQPESGKDASRFAGKKA